MKHDDSEATPKRAAKKSKKSEKADGGSAALPERWDAAVVAQGSIAVPNMRTVEELLGGAFDVHAADPESRAQELMYEAWQTPTKRKRVSLARQALKVWPDCADAYTVLAGEEASLEKSIAICRQAVAAGERSLGKQRFKQYRGHFWGVLETRPYMRARAGLARCLWAAGSHDEATAHYHDLLRLNPGDNQGIRYTLLGCLLERDKDAEAAKLLKQYKGDCGAAWVYPAALLRFRSEGDTPGSRKALEHAMRANPHVPHLLLGKKKLPARLPDFIGMGDPNEAVAYVADGLSSWQRTPGALEWLRART